MKRHFTRDVSQEMMEELKEGGAFAPIVEFVSNPENELALCFRGNDTEIGKVMVYKNNHLIWKLSISRGRKPVVEISANHARFMEDWNGKIQQLMDNWGFRGPREKTFVELDQTCDEANNRHGLIKASKDGETYSIVDLKFIPSEEHKLDDKFVKGTFLILDEMQKSYFKEDDNKNNRPVNYFKKYYLDPIDKEECYSKPQPCLEKHVQQELFLSNHEIENGIFIYDLEFAQPKKKGVDVEKNNEPDMLGIRFDKNGKAVSICMIEVKSTWSALTGKSGLKEHLSGMIKYIKDEDLMCDRKREAWGILKQYRELGLYGVTKEYTKDDFINNLRHEIIFVFSDEAYKEYYKKRRIHKYDDDLLKKDPTIDDYLVGFEKDEMVKGGKCDVLAKSMIIERN